VAAEAAARCEEAAKDEGWMMSMQEVGGTEESDRRRIHSPCVEADLCRGGASGRARSRKSPASPEGYTSSACVLHFYYRRRRIGSFCWSCTPSMLVKEVVLDKV
jgi:hypothetical protein